MTLEQIEQMLKELRKDLNDTMEFVAELCKEK